MRKISFNSVLLAIFIFSFASPARAQSDEEQFIDAGEWVVTASKHLQRIDEAPAATTVITEEDIHQSGALTIPELLRIIPGIDVMTIDAGEDQVCARGFNRPFSNKMLVMIDGRSMYLDFLGVIWWEALNVVLEDIKRIEVVRGPGSALYGANAFSGVINIITKPPEEVRGTRISATGGSRGTVYAAAENAEIEGKFGHKVTVQFSNSDRYSPKDENAFRIYKGRGLLEYDLGLGGRLSLDAGGVRDSRMLFDQTGGFFRIDPENIYHVDLYYRNPKSYARIFWNGGKSKANFTEFIFEPDILDFLREFLHWNLPDLPVDYRYSIFFNTIDLEAQRVFAWKELLTLTAGASLRINTADSKELFEKNEFQEQGAGYLQFELNPLKPLRLVAGARVDFHSLAGVNVSPRASFIYTPWKNHSLRFSYARAFRNPSFLESYATFTMTSTNITMVSEGNDDLEPEKMQSFELGYRSKPTETISASFDLFYNLAEDFIEFPVLIDRENVTLDTLFKSMAEPMTYRNFGRVRAIGGELELKAKLLDRLSGLVNYSYQNLTNLEDKLNTLIDEEGKRIKTNPEHKINVGFSGRILPRISGSILAYYQSRTDWPSIVGMDRPAHVDAFVTLNARLAYEFWEGKAEVSAAGYNLIEPHHEYPRTAEISRRIAGTAQVRF